MLKFNLHNELDKKDHFLNTTFDSVDEFMDWMDEDYDKFVDEMETSREDWSGVHDFTSKYENGVAFVGEEDLYNFLRSWLSNIDFSSKKSTLQLEFNKLIKGNVKELKEQINGEWATNIVALATVSTQEKEDGVKEFQNVYNKAFLPPYSIKAFRLLDYNSAVTVSALRQKGSKDLKPHERFVINVTGEYGCKDYYTFKELRDYNSDDNLVASDKVIAEDDSDF